MAVMTYEIDPEGDWIKCLICGLTSYNPADVQNHYCGNCHIFHDEEPALYKLLSASGRRP